MLFDGCRLPIKLTWIFVETFHLFGKKGKIFCGVLFFWGGLKCLDVTLLRFFG